MHRRACLSLAFSLIFSLCQTGSSSTNTKVRLKFSLDQNECEIEGESNIEIKNDLVSVSGVEVGKFPCHTNFLF